MSDKITFKQLVELIAKQSKQSESSANSFIHELVQIIESGLKDSGSVSISGFGKFELRWMKERAGVNPQTGDEITIPGQNKVVFKPYKALRETVNKPFANLEPEVLEEKNGSEKSSKEENEEDSDDPFGIDDVFGAGASQDSDSADDDTTDPFDSDSDADYDPADPFGFDKKAKESNISKDYNQYIDDLIFEKENPHFGPPQQKTTSGGESSPYAYNSDEEDVLVLDEEQDDEERPKVAPPIPDESKMAEKVQESGSYKWSYAAAVIIVMVALILLFWMMQRSGDSIEETASTSGTQNQDQTEQVLDQSTAESETATGNEAAANQEAATGDEAAQPDQTAEEESPPPASVDRQAQNNIETESFTVQSGQSLWDIAENQLGNPYLWPVLYQLNQDVLSNPNEIVASSEIEIPTFSDPDNLSEFEREQVALGYFSLYQWNRENNPDEARYFLWAVGVFSQDLLDQPPSEVDSQDLAFARNR